MTTIPASGWRTLVLRKPVIAWALYDCGNSAFATSVMVGLAQGGVQSLSRSYFARLIPPDKPAEFFGFYNMIGKFAAVPGPFFVAIAAAVTGNARSAVAAVLPLLLAGAVVLMLVPEHEHGQPSAGTAP